MKGTAWRGQFMEGGGQPKAWGYQLWCGCAGLLLRPFRLFSTSFQETDLASLHQLASLPSSFTRVYFMCKKRRRQKKEERSPAFIPQLIPASGCTRPPVQDTCPSPVSSSLPPGLTVVTQLWDSLDPVPARVASPKLHTFVNSPVTTTSSITQLENAISVLKRPSVIHKESLEKELDQYSQ